MCDTIRQTINSGEEWQPTVYYSDTQTKTKKYSSATDWLSGRLGKRQVNNAPWAAFTWGRWLGCLADGAPPARRKPARTTPAGWGWPWWCQPASQRSGCPAPPPVYTWRYRSRSRCPWEQGENRGYTFLFNAIQSCKNTYLCFLRMALPPLYYCMLLSLIYTIIKTSAASPILERDVSTFLSWLCLN